MVKSKYGASRKFSESAKISCSTTTTNVTALSLIIKQYNVGETCPSFLMSHCI